MFPFLPKRIALVALGLFTILCLGWWYFSTFSPPQNVTITDLSDKSAAVVWNSKEFSKTTLFYSTHPFLLKILPLSYFFVSHITETQKSVDHRLEIANLKPNTTYYLAIASNFHYYLLHRIALLSGRGVLFVKPDYQSLPQIQTKSQTSNPNKISIPGRIVNGKNIPVIKAIVTANSLPDFYQSTLTDSKGFFTFSIPASKSAGLILEARHGTSILSVKYYKKVDPSLPLNLILN